MDLTDPIKDQYKKTQLFRNVAVDKEEPQEGAKTLPTAQIIHLNRHVTRPVSVVTDRSDGADIALPSPPDTLPEKLEQELRSLRAAYAAALTGAMLAAFGQSPWEDFRPDPVRIDEVFGEAVVLSEAFIRKLPQEPDDTPA